MQSNYEKITEHHKEIENRQLIEINHLKAQCLSLKETLENERSHSSQLTPSPPVTPINNINSINANNIGMNKLSSVAGNSSPNLLLPSGAYSSAAIETLQFSIAKKDSEIASLQSQITQLEQIRCNPFFLRDKISTHSSCSVH